VTPDGLRNVLFSAAQRRGEEAGRRLFGAGGSPRLRPGSNPGGADCDPRHPVRPGGCPARRVGGPPRRSRRPSRVLSPRFSPSVAGAPSERVQRMRVARLASPGAAGRMPLPLPVPLRRRGVDLPLREGTGGGLPRRPGRRPAGRRRSGGSSSPRDSPFWAAVRCGSPGSFDGTPALQVVPRVCGDRAFPARWEEMDRARFIHLPDLRRVLERLGRKERHEAARRKMRRAANCCPASPTASPGRRRSLRGTIPTFVDLHRRSHPEKSGSWTTGWRPSSGNRRGVPCRGGSLRLAFLSFDGGDAASAFQFSRRRFPAALQLRLRPGHTGPPTRASGPHLARCIEDAVALGRTEYDFLRGEER